MKKKDCPPSQKNANFATSEFATLTWPDISKNAKKKLKISLNSLDLLCQCIGNVVESAKKSFPSQTTKDISSDASSNRSVLNQNWICHEKSRTQRSQKHQSSLQNRKNSTFLIVVLRKKYKKDVNSFSPRQYKLINDKKGLKIKLFRSFERVSRCFPLLLLLFLL